MSDQSASPVSAPTESVSRRRLLTGAAAVVAGAGTGVAMTGATNAGAPPLRAPDLSALNPVIAGLTYIGFDAFAFFPDLYPRVRRYDTLSGMGIDSQSPGNYLDAPISLPVGSVIRQINVAYQGTPIVDIGIRNLASNPNIVGTPIAISLAGGGGAQTQTIELDGSANNRQPITIEANKTYTLRFFMTIGASIYGATIGYTPATQTFLPFDASNTDPRILDTRQVGGKLQPGEERTVALGFPGVRSAVINLAITETEGAGGFVSVYPANIAWPENASINWSAPNQNISNGVISAVDANAAIKIRAGAAATHVVIDRVGWFL